MGKVTGIEMFYKILEEARGLKLSDMWVVKFKTVEQNNSFRAQVRNMSYTP